MRIRRGLLFWGLFLIPLGGLPLLARAGVLDGAQLAEAWRLWPLVLVALGLALILGRSRASLAGTTVAALALGILAGSALASGTAFIGSITDCGVSRATDHQLDRHGTFSGATTATLELDCGSVSVATTVGTDWRVHAAYRGAAPRIDATDTSLSLRGPGTDGIHRQDWTVTLGAAQLRHIDLTANAATGTISLAGATLDTLTGDVNAGDVLIDGTEATIGRIDLTVNAGRMRVTLGSGGTGGSLSANAGAFDLCVPPTATLRFQLADQLTFSQNLSQRGLTKSGDTWTRSGTGPDVIDLSIDGNAASLTLDPDGGCGHG